MTGEQMDDIIQAVIERINVTAVDPTSMKLTILLKMGIFTDVKYERFARRSGHISKKIFPERRSKFIRHNRRVMNHQTEIHYTVDMAV